MSIVEQGSFNYPFEIVGLTRPGIEPGPPRHGANDLTTRPPSWSQPQYHILTEVKLGTRQRASASLFLLCLFLVLSWLCTEWLCLIDGWRTVVSFLINDLVLCWCVLHAPCLTSSGVNGYALDSTAGAWPQQVKFTLPVHIFTDLGFPECPCCHVCNIYSRLCHGNGLVIFD